MDLPDLDNIFDDEDWYCEFQMGIDEVRVMYEIISYALETWPGSPRRPVEEQEYLSYMKKKLFAMISDYNFYIS